MSDDIVTRLREKYSGQLPIVLEAADEIERLRALVNRWETCELVAESLCDMDNPESFCDTCKEPF